MIVFGAKIKKQELSTEKLAELMEEYSPDIFKDAMEDVDGHVEDIPNWLSSYDGGSGGNIIGLLADIINTEEGLDLEASDAEDTIFIRQGFPWEASERMKNLQAEDVKNFLEKYLEDVVPFEVGYFNLDNDLTW